MDVIVYNRREHMGNSGEFCGNRCKNQLKNSTVRLNESACVEFKDDLPLFRGRFNFEKQASFSKLEKAALDYCDFNHISKIHSPIIARLLAYQQSHYFQAMKQLPIQMRQQFVTNQADIDLQLIDSLYHYFLIKQTYKMNPYQIFGCTKFKIPPTIDVAQLELHNLISITQIGQRLLREGRVGLIIMMAGHSQYSKQTSKGLAQLPLIGSPTTLELLMNRFSSLLFQERQMRSSRAVKRVPVIIICCENNYVSVQQLFCRNNFFGLEQKSIKIILDQTQIPLITPNGKLCLSYEHKTLSYPIGTARAVYIALHEQIRHFLAEHRTEYLHFIGCDNISEIPGDPLMLGLTHKFNRNIAGKCMSATSLYQKYPRYVASQNSYHLVDSMEMEHLGNLTLMIDSPIALNSMVFRLQTLAELYRTFQVNMYIAKRFHMQSVRVNCYDFELKKPVNNAQVFNFEQDIRDYISASLQTIVVKYNKSHFKPILSVQNLKQYCKDYCPPTIY